MELDVESYVVAGVNCAESDLYLSGFYVRILFLCLRMVSRRFNNKL